MSFRRAIVFVVSFSFIIMTTFGSTATAVGLNLKDRESLFLSQAVDLISALPGNTTVEVATKELLKLAHATLPDTGIANLGIVLEKLLQSGAITAEQFSRAYFAAERLSVDSGRGIAIDLQTVFEQSMAGEQLASLSILGVVLGTVAVVVGVIIISIRVGKNIEAEDGRAIRSLVEVIETCQKERSEQYAADYIRMSADAQKRLKQEITRQCVEMVLPSFAAR